MKRAAGLIVVSALGGVLATAAVAQRSERPGAPVAAQPATRWEYATLRFNFLSQKWEWLSADRHLLAEKAELHRTLGGTPRPDGREISYIDVANQAGAHGWEILTLHERDQGTEIVFKRPAQ
jgi:hypothetical protein